MLLHEEQQQELSPMTEDFDGVWMRIVGLEGATFRQIRGQEFTYRVRVGVVVPGRVDQIGRDLSIAVCTALRAVHLVTTSDLIAPLRSTFKQQPDLGDAPAVGGVFEAGGHKLRPTRDTVTHSGPPFTRVFL
jgi:hypothetical protein